MIESLIYRSITASWWRRPRRSVSVGFLPVKSLHESRCSVRCSAGSGLRWFEIWRDSLPTKMRELNATACAALYERVEWSGPWILVTLIVLAIVNVMVVLGNVLVILAVYHTSKLRNVTNMFIVSLAVADLMVGLAVLPFSATWEVFKVRLQFYS